MEQKQFDGRKEEEELERPKLGVFPQDTRMPGWNGLLVGSPGMRTLSTGEYRIILKEGELNGKEGLPKTNYQLSGFTWGALFILPTAKLVSNEIMSAVKTKPLNAGFLSGLRESQLSNLLLILGKCIKQNQGNFGINELNKKHTPGNTPNS